MPDTRDTPTPAQYAVLERLLSPIGAFEGCTLVSSYVNDDGDYVVTLDDPRDEFEYVAVMIFADGTWEA